MKTMRIYLRGRPDPVKSIVKDVSATVNGSNGPLLALKIIGSATEFEFINLSDVMMVTTDKIVEEPAPRHHSHRKI